LANIYLIMQKNISKPLSFQMFRNYIQRAGFPSLDNILNLAQLDFSISSKTDVCNSNDRICSD
jgi:hypothetical protein